MTYNEWRDELQRNLLSVPETERRRVLDYYAEAYADRREAGFSEREIIKEFGAPYDAAQRILSENKNGDYAPPPPRPEAFYRGNNSYANGNAFANNGGLADGQAVKADKKSHKGLIAGIVSAVVIILLALVVVFAVFTVKACVRRPEFEMLSYTAEQDNTVIDITVNAGTVKTEFYDGDKIIIDYPVADVCTGEIHENNGVFSYENKINKTWFWGNWDIPETTIKLPLGVTFDVDFEVNAGVVRITGGNLGEVKIAVNAGLLDIDGVTCGKFDCEVNAGKLSAKRIQCSDIAAQVDAGELEIDIIGAKAEYDIKADVSFGSCNVSNQTVGGGKKLDVQCSAGSIKVTFTN